MGRQGSMPRYSGIGHKGVVGGYIDIIETTGSAPVLEDPDPGNDFSFTTPDSEIWEVLSFSITFAASATNADRNIRVEIQGPDGHRLFVASIGVKKADTTTDIIIAQWGHNPSDVVVTDTNDVARAPFPRKMMLPPGSTILTDTGNIQPGDDYSNPHILVERFGH